MWRPLYRFTRLQMALNNGDLESARDAFAAMTDEEICAIVPEGPSNIIPEPSWPKKCPPGYTALHLAGHNSPPEMPIWVQRFFEELCQRVLFIIYSMR